MGLDWANMENKNSCVFFCQKQHIPHNSCCALLLKNGMVISHCRGVKETVSDTGVNLWFQKQKWA